MLIDVKSNNINEFEIVNFEKVLFMKKKSYLLKYRIRFNSLRKLYILSPKTLITCRKISKSVNQIYKNLDNFIEKALEILVIFDNFENY